MDNYELSWHKFPCYQIMILWDLLCNPASCRLLRALQNNFLSTDMEMALSQGGTIFSPTKGKKKASFASVCIFMSTFLTYKCLWFLDFPLHWLWHLTGFLVNESNKIMLILLLYESCDFTLSWKLFFNSFKSYLEPNVCLLSWPPPPTLLICIYIELVVSICNSYVL